MLAVMVWPETKSIRGVKPMPELVSEVIMSFSDKLNSNRTFSLSLSARVKIAVSSLQKLAELCFKCQSTSNSAFASWSRILGFEIVKSSTEMWHLG